VFFRLFPEWYGRRSIAREQAFHDQQDTDSFQAAAIPDGEVVGLRCVWIMEVYLASHVNRLVHGLRELGLDQPEPGRENPVDAILKARVAGGGGGWVNFPWLVPARGNWPRSMAVPTTLPSGVNAVYMKAISTVPGVTVLVAQFRFDETTSGVVQAPLKTMYRTRALPEGHYITYPSGTHLRDEAVLEQRAMLRRRCERWIQSVFPGAYAGFATAPTPACELLTFEQGDPLGGRMAPTVGEKGEISAIGIRSEYRSVHARGGGEEDYLAILGQRDDWDAWACAEMPGLVLRLPRVKNFGRSEDHVVLSARVPTFGIGSSLWSERDRTPQGITAATGWLSHTLAMYAVARLVVAYENQVAQIRDRLGDVELERPRRAITQMERVERDLARIARDARPMLKGIATAPAHTWRSEIYTFLPISEHRRDGEPLFTSVSKRLLEQATRLSAVEEETRETARAIGSLVVTAANLKAARTNIRLQFLAILLAMLAVLIAILAAPAVLKLIEKLLRR
jgi:hypothetical protein